MTGLAREAKDALEIRAILAGFFLVGPDDALIAPHLCGPRSEINLAVWLGIAYAIVSLPSF